MILTRSPLRIPLGGGGTDLPSYYSKHDGFILSMAIDKYNTVMINKNEFSNVYEVINQKINSYKSIKDIEHNIIRECLNYYRLHNTPLCISSYSDVPIGSGLGGSGAFTVALLAALEILKGNYNINKKNLAELACYVEIEKLKQPSGKQDQYISALGGIKCLNINKEGEVIAENINVKSDILDGFLKNLVMFHTGKSRKSSKILQQQSDDSQNGVLHVIEGLHKIKEMGFLIKEHLIKGNIDEIGLLFHQHWMEKTKMNSGTTNENINYWYDLAIRNGALGGKIMGAGDGGFFLFYCEKNKQKSLIQQLEASGLREINFNLDYTGLRVIFSDKL